MNDRKTYLGDGVYVRIDVRGIWLTTENGVEATNSIFLEPEVLRSFSLWLGGLSDPSFHLLTAGIPSIEDCQDRWTCCVHRPEEKP
jgi:hypothetical protein